MPGLRVLACALPFAQPARQMKKSPRKSGLSRIIALAR